MALKLIALGFCLFFVVILTNANPRPLEFAKARFANRFDKIHYCYEAQKQLREKRLSRVCLYCGSFPKWKMKGIIPYLIILLTGEPPGIFVPSANRGIDIIGVAGAGKTASAGDPLCASAIDQNFPLCVYDAKAKEDAKSGQISYLATLALRRGYKVNIFAPGKPYSCTINPLDFLRSHLDATKAESIALNFLDNLGGKSDREDSFFGPAARRVLFGSFLMAKGSPYPDLAMAFSIIKLPNLAQRLLYAQQRGAEHYQIWHQNIFSQLVALIDSQKTLSSVLGNADTTINRFIQPDILPCIIGNTDVSLKLGTKEILFLQSDSDRINIVNPLLASVIGLSIGQNFGTSRTVPIVYSFDEVATIKVDGMYDWPNIFRSQGYVSFYAAQSIEQYYERYSENQAAILRNTCATRMWFNPGSDRTSEKFTKYLGKKLITVVNKSHTKSRHGRTTTISKQKKEVDLVEASEWNGFEEGELVFVNPEVKSSRKPRRNSRGSIPWKIKRMPIPQSDFDEKKECETIWEEKLVSKFLGELKFRRANIDYEAELKKREAFAEQLLPLPPAKVEVPC